MKKRIIILTTLLLLIFSTLVFGVDTESKVIDSDLYLSKDQYVLDKEVSGNVFNVSSDFELSPSSIINGDLFLVAKKITLKSDVTYTDALSKDNELSIDKINSSSKVTGNVYVVCNEFTLEPGVEIQGDLYIVAKSINIQKSSIIHGNVFATAGSFILNGKVENSVYTSANTFSTNYYGSIYKDLNLTADSVILNSVVRRNANIDANSVVTDSDFLIYGNLSLNSKSCKFSGEVDGNANIVSKTLDFVDSKEDKTVKCLIKGNLKYSSEKEVENVDSFVNGAVVHSSYKSSENVKPKFSFKNLIVEFLTFIVYVFVIAWLFTLLNKKYLDKTIEINVGNIFAALGIGLLAILAVFILSILLFILNIGVTLSFALIIAYIFLLFISTPLFVLDIAILLKDKINVYIGILVISLVLFVIYQVPFVGGLISFLFTTIGSGRIILKMLKK